MKKLTIVKVGGAVVEDEAQLSALIENFSAIEGAKLLVHGGGRRATKVAAALGIETKMVGGRRITDADMLSVVTMVYGGLVNKNIVAQLQAAGQNAMGLTGADMNVIRSKRRAPKKVKEHHDELTVISFVSEEWLIDSVTLKNNRHPWRHSMRSFCIFAPFCL